MTEQPARGSTNPFGLMGAVLGGSSLTLAFLPVPLPVLLVLVALAIALCLAGMALARREGAPTLLPRAGIALALLGAVIAVFVASTGLRIPL